MTGSYCSAATRDDESRWQARRCITSKRISTRFGLPCRLRRAVPVAAPSQTLLKSRRFPARNNPRAVTLTKAIVPWTPSTTLHTSRISQMAAFTASPSRFVIHAFVLRGLAYTPSVLTHTLPRNVRRTPPAPPSRPAPPTSSFLVPSPRTTRPCPWSASRGRRVGQEHGDQTGQDHLQDGDTTRGAAALYAVHSTKYIGMYGSPA